MDPFAAMDDLLVPAASGGAPAAVQPIGDLQEWFDKLVAANSGVLYEDPHVQVSRLMWRAVGQLAVGKDVELRRANRDRGARCDGWHVDLGLTMDAQTQQHNVPCVRVCV